MATPTTQKTGLFIVSYQVSSGLLGAPNLHLNFAVNTVDQSIIGQGQVTQAVNPPLDVRSNISGDFTHMTVMPQQTHILVTGTGTPAINWSPVSGVGPVLMPDLYLRMVLSPDWKSGTAYYKYRTADGQLQEVKDVPVKAINNL